MGTDSQRGGIFFSGAVIGILGDFQRLGKVLLVIVVVGIAGFYLAERFWLSSKVEEADPERLQELEQAAQERLQDLRQEFQEHIPFKQSRRLEQKKQASRAKRRKAKKTLNTKQRLKHYLHISNQMTISSFS